MRGFRVIGRSRELVEELRSIGVPHDRALIKDYGRARAIISLSWLTSSPGFIVLPICIVQIPEVEAFVEKHGGCPANEIERRSISAELDDLNGNSMEFAVMSENNVERVESANREGARSARDAAF